MIKYVALLRGINVGGNKKVGMTTLKKCFEEMGYINVFTYINSGNVIFETKELDRLVMANNIEDNLKDVFGFGIGVVVRNSMSIKKLCEEVPSSWTNDSEQKTDVMFLWNKYDSKKSLAQIETKANIDTLIYVEGAIVWNIRRSNYKKSGMNKFIGTKVYRNMTARNINTVRKIAALMETTKAIA